MPNENIPLSASATFAGILRRAWCRGWYSAWPTAEDGMSVIYVQFHLPPDNAEVADIVLRGAIAKYGGETQWYLGRSHINRFLICPEIVRIEGDRMGYHGRAPNVVRDQYPELERRAAIDLLKLTEYLASVEGLGLVAEDCEKYGDVHPEIESKGRRV